MTYLTDLHDHARERANWQPGEFYRPACKTVTTFGMPKPADHANCGGHKCGCNCHRPTDKERRLWRQIADEIGAYLSPEDDDEEPADDVGDGPLFGEAD